MKIDGHSLRMYKSNYKGIDFYRQTDTRCDTRTGYVLENKKVKILYFIDGDKSEFKTEKEMIEYIDNKIKDDINE